ncbi:hypothetical protein CgunFtcFv8_019153 [Champsocephalus gunnari]|uniref:Uncharacterized protein n=1 Tax=Champsocephalus gunnari TaxID=52237 RepID=A0AAN8HMF6_CHAGU|nr:hypothetical protein CgunFtcFv8_019153 [Champsocephalus gunnari]
MGPRLFLLLALTLLLFTDHSQGIPETHEKSLDVSKFSDASIFGELLTTANPIDIPRQRNRACYCEGKGTEMKSRCLCQQSGSRNGRNGKWKTFCQKKKNKNLRTCRRFSKLKKGGNTRNLGPSVPI